MIDGLLEHFENELGASSRNWSQDPEGVPWGFQVVEYAPGRIDDAVIWSTLGLSDHVLESATADGRFRLELMLIAPTSFRETALPFILGDVGRMIAERAEMPDIGTVMRNNRTLADLSSMASLYVGRALYFTQEFSVFRSADDRAVNVNWLIPVSEDEGEFIGAEGWRRFEELMYASDDFDPIDLGRESML